MKGIFFKKNEDLYVMVGTVKEIKDSKNAFEVTIEYDVYNRDERKEEKQSTVLIYQNQVPLEDSEKKPIPWADFVRKMKLREGSTIFTLARPSKNFVKADAYTCRYSGIMAFPADDEHEAPRHVIGGLVSWIRDKTDVNGKPYVSMGVYIGKNKDGEYQTVTVNIRNEKMLERCKKALSPRDDGSKRYALFACGDAYVFLNNEGFEVSMYTAYDFTVTGVRTVHQA